MLLEIKDLVKYYGDKKIIELPRFTLDTGDRAAVAGRNGSGKTTLLKLIAGEIEPDAGRIDVKGSIAVIPQLDNGCVMGGVDERIAGKLGLYDNAFSGGERVKQRIANAFSAHADILLADEPTTNLDIAGICRLEELLRAFRGGLCWYRTTGRC